LQDYDFILQHISGKTNIRVDILSGKNQVDNKEDNKNIKMPKDKLWKRRISTKVKITVWKLDG